MSRYPTKPVDHHQVKVLVLPKNLWCDSFERFGDKVRVVSFLSQVQAWVV